MAKKLLNLDTQEHEWVLSEKEYEAVQGRLDWLAALEAAGVDNWEGYDVAIQISNGEDPY